MTKNDIFDPKRKVGESSTGGKYLHDLDAIIVTDCIKQCTECGKQF